MVSYLADQVDEKLLLRFLVDLPESGHVAEQAVNALRASHLLMLLLKAAIVGVVAYVVSGRETLAHIMPLSCEILDETVDGQSRLNAMLNIFALLDALIQRGVASLVWDTEMLNILPL